MAVSFQRNANPGVVHANSQENLIPHVVVERAPIDPPHDFGQNEPARHNMITSLLFSNPAGLKWRGANLCNHFLPRQLFGNFISGPESASMREQVANRNRLLAVLTKFGN